MSEPDSVLKSWSLKLANEELLWTIAVAHIMFGPQIDIQAPPSLTPGTL